MNTETIPVIIAMGIVTYIPRWLPLFFLSRRHLPHWFALWLDFIPVAVLSALILPAIVTTGTPRQLAWNRPEFWVAVPTLLFAIRTRSLAGTALFGMALYWLTSVVYPLP